MHEIARRHGLTEHEIVILGHLDKATELYRELPDHHDKDLDGWVAHKEALARLLMVRVVKRDHPEGWLTEAEEQYRRLEEELAGGQFRRVGQALEPRKVLHSSAGSTPHSEPPGAARGRLRVGSS